ncbi:hypothetical protein ACOMHN_065432 [Nucella lapillus]
MCLSGEDTVFNLFPLATSAMKSVATTTTTSTQFFVVRNGQKEDNRRMESWFSNNTTVSEDSKDYHCRSTAARQTKETEAD